MIDALLIYPRLGSFDAMVIDLPLSIIYAATDSIKNGFNIKAVDLRTEKRDWKGIIGSYLEKGVRLTGISVMTGTPLRASRDISIFIRENYPKTKILWGGPHPTVLPETINEHYIDYLIRGYGSLPLAELIAVLKKGEGNISDIKGISYKQNGKAFHNTRTAKFEMIHYIDVPYHLINVNDLKYLRSYNTKRIFPIFTSIGCPYQCNFCISPSIYKEINGPKWEPFVDDEVIEHIEYIIKKFGAKHIVILDDTSFPSIKRMQDIFQKIVEKDLNITLEFRGARVNEIDKMDDDFLSLMVKAGGRVLMVGVESGSDRVLKNIQKGITKEQILRVNKKLARYPKIKVHYNFIYGSPGETYNDIIETKEVALQLLTDNPSAYFGFGSDWKPIPGTQILEVAKQKYHYREPKSIDEWIQMDSSDAVKKIVHPWYTTSHNNLIKLLQMSSFVVDDKIIKESSGNKSLFFVVLRFMSLIYKPIACFRLRYNLHYFMFEYKLWQIIVKLMSKINTSS